MKFELEADRWHFILKLEKTPNYKPEGKFFVGSAQDQMALKEGFIEYYSLTVESRLLEDIEKFGSDSAEVPALTHICFGILLPTDPDELAEDLEVILDEEGLLEHVMKHWELQEDTEGPHWRKK